MTPRRRNLSEDEPLDRDGTGAEIDVTAPGGFAVKVRKVRGYDLLVFCAALGLCLVGYMQWQQQHLMEQQQQLTKQLITSNDRQTIGIAKLTCVLVLPVEERFKEIARDSYCEAVAYDTFRSLAGSDPPAK